MTRADDDEGALRVPIMLGALERSAVSIVGLVTLSIGVVATFKSDNQAGTTGLVLIGSISFLIGLAGRVPDRIGREGVVYDPASYQAKQVLRDVLADDRLDLDARARVAETVRQYGEPPSVPERTEHDQSLSVDADLQQEADGVLYAYHVRRNLERRGRLPVGAVLRNDVLVPGGVASLVVARDDTTVDPNLMVAIEPTINMSPGKPAARVRRLLALRFAAVVVVVPDGSPDVRLNDRDRAQVVSFGQRQGQGWIASDPDTVSLAEAVRRAWTALA